MSESQILNANPLCEDFRHGMQRLKIMAVSGLPRAGTKLE
jgi:hypothetical protein